MIVKSDAAPQVEDGRPLGRIFTGIYRQERWRAECRHCRWYGEWAMSMEKVKDDADDHEMSAHPQESGASDG